MLGTRSFPGRAPSEPMFRVRMKPHFALSSHLGAQVRSDRAQGQSHKACERHCTGVLAAASNSAADNCCPRAGVSRYGPAIAATALPVPARRPAAATTTTVVIAQVARPWKPGLPSTAPAIHPAQRRRQTPL